jgi:hypothetical protein
MFALADRRVVVELNPTKGKGRASRYSSMLRRLRDLLPFSLFICFLFLTCQTTILTAGFFRSFLFICFFQEFGGILMHFLFKRVKEIFISLMGSFPKNFSFEPQLMSTAVHMEIK